LPPLEGSETHGVRSIRLFDWPIKAVDQVNSPGWNLVRLGIFGVFSAHDPVF
jgi:hypothetical protein